MNRHPAFLKEEITRCAVLSGRLSLLGKFVENERAACDLEGRISTTPTTEILERLGTLRRFGRKFPTTSVRAGVRSDGKIVSWDGKFV